MLADNITNLSQASIWRMNNLAPASQDTSNIQSSIVLQILKINDSTPEDESTNPILLLSDGVYYDKFLFYSNAKKELRVLNLKENDIICCKVIPAKIIVQPNADNNCLSENTLMYHWNVNVYILAPNPNSLNDIYIV